MSNRTLVEINHDYCPRDEAECLALGRALQAYIRAANREQLPQGVELKHYRHHSEPCPLEDAQRVLKDLAKQANACVARIIQ